LGGLEFGGDGLGEGFGCGLNFGLERGLQQEAGEGGGGEEVSRGGGQGFHGRGEFG
jgi:hypothetical protein